MKKLSIFAATLLLTACSNSSENSAEVNTALVQPSVSTEQGVGGFEGESTVPEIGQCFNYTAADVDNSNPVDKQVDCSESHSAEVYRIGIWPEIEDPNTFSDDETWAIANEICMPWDGDGGNFNYWAFYFPTTEAWNNGENWVRCDGMRTLNDEPLEVEFWTGAILGTTP